MKYQYDYICIRYDFCILCCTLVQNTHAVSVDIRPGCQGFYPSPSRLSSQELVVKKEVDDTPAEDVGGPGRACHDMTFL